jgi:protein gp37
MYRDKERYGQDGSIVQRSKTKFAEPLKWREPRRIFTCSWSDWFIAEADGWRADAWDVIRQTPQHTYMILTKRPERILAHLPTDWGDGWPNVWLGVSVENQLLAEKRIPLLQQVPAVVRFLSCEPLLGPLHPDLTGIHWLIAGGESGPNFRPMHPDWALSLRDQCQREGVPFWFKQQAGPRSEMNPVLDGREWRELPKEA